MLQQRMHRVLALAAVAVLVAGSTVVGALVLAQPETTDGVPSAAPSTRPPLRTDTATPPSSGVPTPSASPPSTTVTASSAPGANALALAGNGTGSGQFSPATESWSLHTTYSCSAGAQPFLLVVSDVAGVPVVTTQGPSSGDERRTITGAGPFVIEISGGCSWTVEATG
jgi:hypothetical protein